MNFRSRAGVILAVAAFSEVLYFLYKKKVHQRLWGHVVASSASGKSGNELEVAPSADVFHQVLFFPDKERTCFDHILSGRGCGRPKCPFSHEVTNFSRMVQPMLNAEKSLDLCMYLITNNDLAELVVILHERSVRVRVITDDEAINMSGTFIGKFRRAGIQVRRDYSNYLMHHKFAIIDGTTLINGSFNWTCQAVNSNNENVLITNNPEIVAPFIVEYERLWEVFDPVKRPP